MRRIFFLSIVFLTFSCKKDETSSIGGFFEQHSGKVWFIEHDRGDGILETNHISFINNNGEDGSPFAKACWVDYFDGGSNKYFVGESNTIYWGDNLKPIPPSGGFPGNCYNSVYEIIENSENLLVLLETRYWGDGDTCDNLELDGNTFENPQEISYIVRGDNMSVTYSGDDYLNGTYSIIENGDIDSLCNSQ